ncbi:uncharacterized protein BP5553_01178 [Venustampulla echinocandica]|uniref:AA1-like domain-containing protein n=1 Tax=Venustampulla echinocandica TaxID=2656787 RepID=A0A370U0A1_9HELO|nr:uncharacterized protein BP5553_01178 [Venustampulla echinocandica]RDL41199.1 hypothetical protein BP5553_01178 [Venustampulla echinocandica]
MQLLKVLAFSAIAASFGSCLPTNGTKVAVPWKITSIIIENTIDGVGGIWSFEIADTPTPAPQGFNTSCHYYNPDVTKFAVDGNPIDQPCEDANVRFSMFQLYGDFTLSVHHTWGDCSIGDVGEETNEMPCTDFGSFTFSIDEVLGQQSDSENNFGQYGHFFRDAVIVYPQRQVPSNM